jgi:hypothetical protein
LINNNVRGVPGAGPVDAGEVGEIKSVGRQELVPKALPELLPQEADASMPSLEDQVDRKIALLNRAIGLRLSVNNPVWTGDPVPRMRALQKRIIEYSLGLEQPQRQPAMEAVRVVEQAVQLRLRWQQMQRSDLEGDVADDEDQGAGNGGNAKRIGMNEEFEG